MALEKAYTNIAIVKYWGKHPKWEDLFVPTKSSLSFTVKDLYTETEVIVEKGSGKVKELIMNGKRMNVQSKEWKRVQDYVERLGKVISPTFLKYNYVIKTSNNFPTSAGLASSASGYAALAKALISELSKEHSWASEIYEDPKKLSVIARLGSGSAARSINRGVVLWVRGWDKPNFDPVWSSYSESIEKAPDEIAIAYILLDEKEKKISSREGMSQSVKTSPFYWSWVEMEEFSLGADISSITQKKWEELFPRIIKHSNTFHAICRSTYPPIEYLTTLSFEIMRRIHHFIEEFGNTAAYTFDAGPNPVIIYHKDVERELQKLILDHYNVIKTSPV